MEKFKSLTVKYRYLMFLVLEIVILIIGGFVAYLTVYRYGLIVRAILGLTIIYLFHLEYVVFKRLKNESFGIKFEFPKDIKYFVMDFFVFIIWVWAGVQVLDLVRYLIHIFTSK